MESQKIQLGALRCILFPLWKKTGWNFVKSRAHTCAIINTVAEKHWVKKWRFSGPFLIGARDKAQRSETLGRGPLSAHKLPQFNLLFPTARLYQHTNRHLHAALALILNQSAQISLTPCFLETRASASAFYDRQTTHGRLMSKLRVFFSPNSRPSCFYIYMGASSIRATR